MNLVGETLLSDEETATAIGVAQKTLPAWRHLGKGPAYLKVGKRCFYRPSDIKAWLEKQIINPASRRKAAEH
jgi:predicted site-specific integrase-resolvase